MFNNLFKKSKKKQIYNKNKTKKTKKNKKLSKRQIKKNIDNLCKKTCPKYSDWVIKDNICYEERDYLEFIVNKDFYKKLKELYGPPSYNKKWEINYDYIFNNQK